MTEQQFADMLFDKYVPKSKPRPKMNHAQRVAYDNLIHVMAGNAPGRPRLNERQKRGLEEVHSIIEDVAKERGYDPRIISGSRTDQLAVSARYEVIKRAMLSGYCSASDIGRGINRDQSSVRSAVRKIRAKEAQ